MNFKMKAGLGYEQEEVGFYIIDEKGFVIVSSDTAPTKEQMAEINARLAQPTEQHQGEPVAWIYELPIGKFLEFQPPTHDCVESRPLYDHADPGEVERLRADLETVKADRDAYAQNAIDLRGQLAEAQEQLRAQDDLLSEAYQHDIGTPLKRKIRDAALSASAEPSAPKPMLFEEPDNYPDPVEPSALRGWVCDEPGTPGEWSKSKIKPVAPVGDGMHDDTEAVRAAMERKQ